MNNVKPNFGGAVGAGPTTQQAKRPEAGAIWERVSSKSQKRFLSVQIRLSKSKLLQLINNESKEDISLSFVAFPNDFYNEGSNRPNFRVYEETPRENNE